MKTQFNLTLAACAAALLGFVHPVSADTLKVPKDKPVFSIDIPDGWSHVVDKDGDITCEPANKDGYELLLLALPDIHTKAALKSYLPELVKSISTKGKGTGLELGDVEDSTNGNDIHFTGVRADGKTGGVPMVYIFHAFEPQKGKWYVFFTVGSETVDKAHSDEYDTITASIEAVK